MQFVDKALARRLESAEEVPQVLYAQVCEKVRPELNCGVERIAGGHAIFAGLGSPIGHAGGIGFDGPVSEKELDQLEEFYRSKNAPAQVDICPLTDSSLLELLKQRSYVLQELNNVLVRKLGSSEPAPALPLGTKIRTAADEEAAIHASIVHRSFFPNGGAPDGFEQILSPMFRLPGAINFLATVNGEAVGAAAGLVIPEHRILALFGAGTLPAFRGRGLQTALLRRRMQAGAEAGCEYAVIVTQGGTTSQRNAERLGFAVAYSKVTLARNW